LWTLLLPREYQVSLVKNESNLEAVAAAYNRAERKLSFLDELRQLAQVASIKGKSGVVTKARYNLKQAGSALRSYAQERAEVDARNAADVQEQAQQIEADIRRLDEMETDTRRDDGDASLYFEQAPGRPQRVQDGVDVDQSLEDLYELGEATAEKAGKKPRGEIRSRPERQRGKLREQAAEQLARLQTMQQEERAQQTPVDPWQPLKSPEEEREEVGAVGPVPGIDELAQEQASQDEQVALGDAPVAASAGHLSLDLDLALVGTAYHFRKLHGEPRLVLRARHEDLSRYLSAVVWAVLCLALAAAAVWGLRRPNASALALRGWPWLAAVMGTAWLFLLPVGVLGLSLLVVSLWVLIARRRKQPGTGAETPEVQH
jgi:hypothetical protein